MPHTRTFAMACPRPLLILPLLAALAACSDDPTGTPPPPGPPVDAPRVLGVYEITLTAIGTSDMRASVVPVSGGPGLALNPWPAGIIMEGMASHSFTDGPRGRGG